MTYAFPALHATLIIFHLVLNNDSKFPMLSILEKKNTMFFENADTNLFKTDSNNNLNRIDQMF